MTRHVFVLRTYPPHPSPSGGVVHTVVEEMRGTHDVTVVAWAGRGAGAVGEPADHVCWLREDEPSRAGRAAERVRVALALPPLRRRARRLGEVLEALSVTEDDVVVGCTPVEAAALGRVRGLRARRTLLMLEHQLPPSPKVVRVPVLGRMARGWVARRERRMIAAADRVLALPLVARDLAAAGAAVSTEVVEVEHPMLRDLTAPAPGEVRCGEPVLVYAGGLDATNRDPRGVLDVLARCRRLRPLTAHFYSYGNCQDLLADRAWSDFLRSHGPVGPEQAERALREAHLVLTIGNADPSHVPSKIFDCVSTGLPVIHFRQHGADPYQKYLERYPYGLVLDLDEDPADLARQLAEAMDEWSGKRLGWDEVRALYPEALPSRLVEALVGDRGPRRDQGPRQRRGPS